MSNSKRLSLLLWALTIVPATAVILTHLNKRLLVGYMRVVDFVDLVVTAPFFLFVLLALHAAVFEQHKDSAWRWVSLAFIGICLYGHAMHVTANAINTYSTEIQDYKRIIPADSYALIYFLDEDLGHWLFYLGLFGVLGIWAAQNPLRDEKFWSTLLSGGLFGLFYAVALIESSQPWIGPLIAIWLLGCAYSWSRSAHATLLQAWKANPLLRFVAAIAVFLLVGQAVYFIAVGGFIQPSAYGY